MHVESVSLRVLPVISRPGLRAEVDSVFAEACNLIAEDGALVSLVAPTIGNAPLNAVVGQMQLLAVLEKGDSVSGDGCFLRLGPGWRLDLRRATSWDPMLPYRVLARWPQVVRQNLAQLRTLFPLEAPPASLAAAPAYHTQGAFGSRPAIALIQSQAQGLIDGLLNAYRKGNLPWIEAFARRLAGLGPGLTPAGDDWLGGWLLGLRASSALAVDPDQQSSLPLESVAEAVMRGAAGQTTALSLAMLQAAADGQAPEPWHDLIHALANADPVPMREASSQVLRHGATSGADALAGFLAALEAEETEAGQG